MTTPASPGPLVGDRFRAVAGLRPCRGAGRARARPTTRAACSWSPARGASVTSPARSTRSCAAGDFHPVVVCGTGREAPGRARRARGHGTILGWTDDMPALMAACDVMVENAGGLTANEAFAVGLPGRHLPAHRRARQGQRRGHGRARRHPLRPHRRRAARRARPTCARPGPERHARSPIAHGLFVGDATDDVLAEAALRSARGIERPIQMPKAPHRIRVAAGSMLALYGLLDPRRAGRRRARRRRRRAAEARARPGVPGRAAHRRRARAARAIRARLDRMHATAIIDATMRRPCAGAADPPARRARDRRRQRRLGSGPCVPAAARAGRRHLDDGSHQQDRGRARSASSSPSVGSTRSTSCSPAAGVSGSWRPTT